MTALLARWTEKLTGGPQAGTSDSPPLARAMGVGRQQEGGDVFDGARYEIPQVEDAEFVRAKCI